MSTQLNDSIKAALQRIREMADQYHEKANDETSRSLAMTYLSTANGLLEANLIIWEQLIRDGVTL